MASNFPESNHAIDQQQIAILQAAKEALATLSLGWRRAAQPLLAVEDYSPEMVNHWLRNWEVLEAAAQGGTSSGYEGAGGGLHDRLALATLKADLERATDLALCKRIHWGSVRRIYELQGRRLDWAIVKNHMQTHAGHLEAEPPYPYGWWWSCEGVARCLGWKGYQASTSP